MNNKLFNTSQKGAYVAPTNTVNNAGGKAYSRVPHEQLAQLANTSCFGDTYYVNANTQLTDVLNIVKNCSDEFIAKTAIYSRRQGLMKDMPALLCAVLAVRNRDLLKKVFPIVINNPKMLRNFVQIIRSGVVGRKSFGTSIRNMIRQYLDSKTPEQLFTQSIGTNPSIGDIIKMVHPKPKDDAMSMTFAYLMGKEVAAKGVLPQILQDYLAFREDQTLPMPDLNFQFLSSLPLNTDQWTQLCLKSTWNTLRMNLNTFARHGVFQDPKVVKAVVARLTDPTEITKARVMPYQIYTAYLYSDSSLPPGIVQALSKAADIALNNIPDFPDNLLIGIDVSGSMGGLITGARGTASTKMRCVDVAALMTAAIAAKSPATKIIPFSDRAKSGFKLAGSIVDSATNLAALLGGGTDCSIPIQHALTMKKVDAIIVISDNESWSNTYSGRGTASMNLWRQVQQKNPDAKLINIDITPSKSTQVTNEKNVINIGGFSDAVFNVLSNYMNGSIQTWTDAINKINIGNAPVASATTVSEDTEEQ